MKQSKNYMAEKLDNFCLSLQYAFVNKATQLIGKILLVER